MSSPFSLLFKTPQKPTKKPKPRNKNPQRGMGVERLERLRLQELQKNGQKQHLDYFCGYPFHLNAPTMPHPVHHGLPVDMYGLNGNCGDLGLKRFENGGGIGSGHMMTSCIKELSSVPNVFVSNMHPQHSSCCHLCFKKKLQNNGDQNIGHSISSCRRSTFSPKISPSMASSDFLGLNLDNNINLNQNKSTESLNTCRASKGKEVVEYEFFPSYSTMKGTGSKEWEFLGSSEASVAVRNGGGGEASSSCLTICDYTSLDTSNSIDLSLKLSC